MTDEPENNLGSPADKSDPTDPPPGENPFRPFRSWAGRYEERSVWKRLGKRISGVFSRRHQETESGPAEQDVGTNESREETITADASAPVAPPDDFKFPWSGAEADAPASVDAVTAPDAPELPRVATPKASLIGRLFRRKSSEVKAPAEALDAEITRHDEEQIGADERFAEPTPLLARAKRRLDDPLARSQATFGLPVVYEPSPDVASDTPTDAAAAEDAASSEPPPIVEEPQLGRDETFTSVDDALPAAEDSPALSAAETVDEAPGFFSRLLGRDKKKRSTLEIEIHEDRIEAAARALDDVGEEQFASMDEPPVDRPALDGFATVDEALPSIEDFAPATAPVLDTIELVGQSATAAVFDGEATLEIEQKTDEFEVVTAPPVEPGEDTLQLTKKSFWTDSFIGRIFRRRAGDTQVETAAAEAQAAAQAHPAFLLSKFRAFYNEIIRFQHQKSEFTAGFATAIVTDYSADLSPDAAAEGLSKRLAELLELQMAEARWMGGEAGERYPDAQYAMAAVADEIFTHMEWEGKGAWFKHKLEARIYKTNAAEVEIFNRIDTLLKDSPDSVVARDLARVYLLVLAAGFQGKWRPFELMRPLAEYRRRLYEYIHAEDPLMLYADDRRVFPDAASRTLEGHAVARFTTMQRWAAILVFLLVSYTVVAHIAWNRASADLKDVTARIKSGGTAVTTAGGETR